MRAIFAAHLQQRLRLIEHFAVLLAVLSFRTNVDICNSDFLDHLSPLALPLWLSYVVLARLSASFGTSQPLKSCWGLDAIDVLVRLCQCRILYASWLLGYSVSYYLAYFTSFPTVM